MFSRKMNIKGFEKPEISIKSDSEGKINYIAFSKTFAYTKYASTQDNTGKKADELLKLLSLDKGDMEEYTDRAMFSIRSRSD